MKINEVTLDEGQKAEVLAVQGWARTATKNYSNAQRIASLAISYINSTSESISAKMAIDHITSTVPLQVRRGRGLHGTTDPAGLSDEEVTARVKAEIEKNKQKAGKGSDDVKAELPRAPHPDDDDTSIGRQAGWDDETHGHLRKDLSITQRAKNIWDKNKLDLSSPGAAMASGGRMGARLMTPRTSLAQQPGKLAIRLPKAANPSK